MFDETESFMEFWQEYIKSDSYYLSFFETQGQISLLKEIEKLPVDLFRQMFFEDITKLIRSFKNKLNIEGYFEGLERKEREKKTIEITYAYIIQFILYKTLVDNDFGDFKQDYNKRIEKIHQAIKNNNYKEILGIINGISTNISKNIYHPFSKEQEFINQKLLELFNSVENKLSDVSPWLDILIFIKKYDFSNVRNEIFGYIYENYLKELYEESKKDQYFTDPAVVDFMLEQIGYTTENIKKRVQNKPDNDYISLVDPSCGSGTFLYSAVDRIIKAVQNGSYESSQKIAELVNNNIFGLDIAEFPLYLAEMNILMRMLPMIITEKYNNPVDKKIKVFLTKDSISEFMDTNIKNTINDLDVEYHKNGGQLALFQRAISLSYQSFVREESDIEEMKRSLENHKLLRRRFDFVIGNPPYVKYNDCAKQGVLIFELMRHKKARLNDIYGMNLHSIPNNPKKYRPNPNLYSFFIALGLALLKDNGKLCYIIPQTVLINPDLDVVRYHLAKFTTIEKIITFSGKMFVGRGLKQDKPVPTSSLIFVVSRKLPREFHQVEVIHYKDPNDDIEKCLQNIIHGKKISKKKIVQVKLLQQIRNWNFIKLDKQFLDFYEWYRENTEDIIVYYNHTLAEKQFSSRFYFDGGYSINEKKLLSSPLTNILNYKCPRLDNKYWTIKYFIGYWPNIREPKNKMFIKLRQGNQGYNLLDSKYKIIWSYNNTTKFFFTDSNIIWARNKILGIGSNNKRELLYLFALLNSNITMSVLSNIIKIQHEETHTILVSLQIIKDQIRIPKITEDNRFIKDEIIKRTEEMLRLEEVKLADLVNFSGVLVQKLDSVTLVGDNLLLTQENEKIRCQIKEQFNLVEKIIREKFTNTKLIENKISLSDLKSLPAIDFEKQRELKDYIDDLVFALYFNVRVSSIGLNKAQSIKDVCMKNKFYKLISRT